jgi:hypothetical protein
MHKDNISYHINELKDGEKFAVVPHEQLTLIANTVNSVQSQVKVLHEMLEAFGIKQYYYTKDVKTLADMPEIKIGFTSQKKPDKQEK